MLCRTANAGLLARSERYGAFDSDPSISGRTAFFRAAQIVTAVLGALDRLRARSSHAYSTEIAGRVALSDARVRAAPRAARGRQAS
jgi:hypothetical protein